MAQIKETQIISKSGADLYLRSIRTKQKAKAIVQINHGLTEHSGRYAEFMQFLAKKGYHAFAHDIRGHGLTAAENLPRGRFAKHDGARKLIKDVDFVVDHIRAQYKNLPIICFGHSMGGLIATNYAQYKPEKVAALAIWNANFQAAPLAPLARFILGFEQFFLGSDVPSPTMSRLTFGRWAKAIEGATSSKDWLTSDPQMINIIRADELSGFAPSISMWQEVINLIERGAHPHGIKHLPAGLPIQLVAGGKDPATDYGKAVEWFANQLRVSGQSNIDYKIFLESRHETLNELIRNEAMDHFVGWADRLVSLKGK